MFHYDINPAALSRLRRHRALPRAAGARQELQVDYFDTPESALAHRGLLLRRLRSGWAWRLELLRQAGGQSARKTAPAQEFLGLGWHGEVLGAGQGGPSGFDFSFLKGDSKALRPWLEKLSAQLAPICSERIREERLQVDTAAGPAGLLLERVDFHVGGHGHPLARVSIFPLGGTGENACHLARALVSEFSLQPCLHSPVQRARHWGTPPTSSKAKPTLPGGQDGGRAFVHIAHNCLAHLCLNLPGLQHSDEPEFVHQARVAIRRLRSALKLFAPWLPEDFVAEFGGRWRDLANALGDCRNLDVFLAETLPLMERELGSEAVGAGEAVARLRRQAERQRKQARQAARAAMDSPATRLLLLDFAWALQQLAFPPAMPALRKLARRRLVKRAQQVTLLGQAVRDLDPEARHELRIAFKKLRYALEFFSGLFGEKKSARYLAGLVDLQEVLGHLNDLATAMALTQALLPASTARLPQAWLSGRVGVLVDALPLAVGHFLAAEAPWAD